jgi:uncharacterized membrane protein YjgN (DUF898 family)
MTLLGSSITDGQPYSGPAAPPPVTRYESFAFTGSGSEYFRIWIVNILLSVVTLGIYSAWAKVRTQQYFYRHTRIAGAGFDYHGRPLAILKGRIVSLALFGGYYIAALISPAAGGIAFVVLMAVLPWLMMRSLKFRLANSSYRGLRFRFSGGTAEAYWVFLGLPVLSVMTLFGLAPLWHHRLKRYQHGHSWYGRTGFAFSAPVSAFYKAYGVAVLCIVVLLVVGVVVFGIVAGTAAVALATSDNGVQTGATLITILFLLTYVLILTGVWALTTALLQNVVWRHTSLGEHRFSSTLEAHRLVKIALANMFLTLCTLGLYRPFAEVNLVRYLAGELTLITSGQLDEFVAGERSDVTAVGEEAMEIFDIDLSL